MLKKIDFIILKEITKKGYIVVKELASDLGISEKTIRNRLNLMKEKEVFKKRIVVDPEYFGYNIKFDIYLKIKKGHEEELFSFLSKEYAFNILYIGTHWGDNDFSVQAIFRKSSEVTKFKKELEECKFIHNVNMIMVPLVFKDVYDWMPKPKNFNMKEEQIELFWKETVDDEIKRYKL